MHHNFQSLSDLFVFSTMLSTWKRPNLVWSSVTLVGLGHFLGLSLGLLPGGILDLQIPKLLQLAPLSVKEQWLDFEPFLDAWALFIFIHLTFISWTLMDICHFNSVQMLFIMNITYIRFRPGFNLFPMVTFIYCVLTKTITDLWLFWAVALL